jgi:hypothetical protein
LKGLVMASTAISILRPPPQESLSWGAAYFSGAAPKLQNHEHIEGDPRIVLNDSMSGQDRRLENAIRSRRVIGNSKQINDG